MLRPYSKGPFIVLMAGAITLRMVTDNIPVDIMMTPKTEVSAPTLSISVKPKTGEAMPAPAIALPVPPRGHQKEARGKQNAPIKTVTPSNSRLTLRAQPAKTWETESTIANTADVLATLEETRLSGEPLLYLAEAGMGPTITLDWPREPAHRDAIFSTFTCEGMFVALYDGNNIYRRNSGRGVAWTAEPSKYSAYLRPIVAPATAKEEAMIASLTMLHGRRGKPVRIFRRKLDAVLLGGLSKFLGTNLSNAQHVHGRYHVSDAAIFVIISSVDSRATKYSIPLARTADVCTA